MLVEAQDFGVSFQRVASEAIPVADTRVQEKRRSDRVAVMLPVRVLVDGADAPEVYEAANLSEGGAFIPTDSPLPVSTGVSLVFLLSFSGSLIQAKGSVVRSIPPRPNEGVVSGMAIKFNGGEGEDLELLQQFLESIAGLEGD